MAELSKFGEGYKFIHSRSSANSQTTGYTHKTRPRRNHIKLLKAVCIFMSLIL